MKMHHLGGAIAAALGVPGLILLAAGSSAALPFLVIAGLMAFGALALWYDPEAGSNLTDDVMFPDYSPGDMRLGNPYSED